jgi:ATP-binding cassette subfamily B protein
VIFAAGGLLALIGCLPWLLRLESVLGLRLFLHRVPLLAPLSGGELDALRTLLQREQFPASTTIVREGEPGDRFYLIKHGRVQIWQRDALEGHRLVRQQGAGDYFGEIALLRDVPRTATVTAATPVEAYCLHRADFQELLRRSPGVAAALEGGTRRYLSGRTRTFLRR